MILVGWTAYGNSIQGYCAAMIPTVQAPAILENMCLGVHEQEQLVVSCTPQIYFGHISLLATRYEAKPDPDTESR